MQTQTETQNTDTTNASDNTNTNANSATTPPIATPPANPTAKRLARMPHVIHLPAETPPPRELKRLIEARIAELESEQRRLDLRDEDQAFEAAANKSILSILHQHLAELRADFPEIDTPLAPAKPADPLPSISPIGPIRLISPISATPPAPAQLTKKNNAEITELSEPAIQPQQHSTEPQPSLSEPSSPPTEPTEPPNPNAPQPIADADENSSPPRSKKFPKIIARPLPTFTNSFTTAANSPNSPPINERPFTNSASAIGMKTP